VQFQVIDRGVAPAGQSGLIAYAQDAARVADVSVAAAGIEIGRASCRERVWIFG
jgi:hypothetical protein